MTHQDHVQLIKNGISEKGGTWADFGSGTGAFTLALRAIAGESVRIYSVDKDRDSLRIQKDHFNSLFPNSSVQFRVADFTKAENLAQPPLDGILMANSLHFVQEKVPLLKRLRSFLKEDGAFLLVEYNVDSGNHWVPYPLSFGTFQNIAKDAGFRKPRLLNTIPSGFLNEMYAAVCYRG